MSTSEPMETAHVRLEGDDWELETKLTVPAGPTHPRELLPLFQALSNGVVGATVNAVQEQGEQVSCKKGCGACCRQLVPISEIEARHIRDLVETLPEPRRSEVRSRFAAARQRLEEAGQLDRLRRSDQWTPDDFTALALAYFRLGIPCPFLDDESCSIHLERPITCREYLVVSPAEDCLNSPPGEVTRVRIPLPVFNAVARLQAPSSKHHYGSTVALILAPEWADAHPDQAPPRPGPELLREFLGHLRQWSEE